MNNKSNETKKSISLEVQDSTMLAIARESYQQTHGANIIIRLLGKETNWSEDNKTNIQSLEVFKDACTNPPEPDHTFLFLFFDPCLVLFQKIHWSLSYLSRWLPSFKWADPQQSSLWSCSSSAESSCRWRLWLEIEQ